MKTNKLLKALLAFVLTFSFVIAFASCGEEPKPEEPKEEACTTHTDNNGDAKCDKCGAAVTPEEPECTEHKDENGDGKCDKCGTDVIPEEPECTEHKDKNGDNKCDNCGADTTPAAPVEKTDITLVENGKGKFNFVVASGLPGEANKAVMLLIQELNKLGIEVENLSDNKNNITDSEVLIGAISTRGDEYKYDEHTLGYDGYCIKVINGKILIVGGSDEALVEAIDVFKKDILGIKKNTTKLDTVTMTTEQNIELIQDDYTVKSVLVAGNDLRDYFILTDTENTSVLKVARNVQDNLYKKIGFWLPIVNTVADGEKHIEIKLTTAKTCESDKGFIAKVENGNIIIDCGFENKIEEATIGFIMSHITNKKTEEVTVKEGYTYEKEDYKNIYYKDFGAKGDGYTDDFFAIKKCHDEANKYGHTVNAEKNSTYYIGTDYQNEYYIGTDGKKYYASITIKTDVNWNGANFIFNDEIVEVQRNEHKDADKDKICDHCKRALTEVCSPRYDSWHSTNIFNILSDNSEIVITDKFKDKTLTEHVTTNIGFAPGRPALIYIQNNNIRQYIRYGVNENTGAAQQEILLVDADGNIDQSAPLQWTYDVVTYATMRYVDDDPITVGGGNFHTIPNVSENYYDSYGRSISVQRSNVTVKDIDHTIAKEGETRAPYGGFLRFNYVTNVVFDNIKVQHHENRYDKGSKALLGTYEFAGSFSFNVSWKNIDQHNFFEEDGTVSYKGLFGTNYCKNFFFDNCTLTSLDAHAGVYNVYVKDSTFEHMNFIGEGVIDIKNTIVYADATGCALNFRSDYGSTWEGEILIDGLELRYSKNFDNIDLISATYTDWWFGYTTHLPKSIKLNNVKLTKYTQKTTDGVRNETVVGTNLIPLLICSDSIYGFGDKDISNLESDGGDAKNNPYKATELVELTNSGNLDLRLPKTKQFSALKYYRDGVQVFDWKDNKGN